MRTAKQRVVIIGGGILGTMHALFAVRAGATVVHLERYEQPRGASVRNFGLVLVSGRAPGADLALALRARELWDEVASDVPGTGFRPNGSITLASSESELRVLEAAAARSDARERGLSLLDPAEVRRVNPGLMGEFLGGLHCSLDAAVEPRLVLGALRRWLEETGRYELLAPREVVDVAERAVVDATGTSHKADLVVLCLGAVHGGVLGPLFASARLQAVRLQMVETESLGRALTTAVADGNTLRYYPAYREFADLWLEPQDERLSRLGIQLLCQQRLNGALTLGDTHEYEQPFAFDQSDEAASLLWNLALGAVGAPLPRIERRWVGVYHQLASPSDDELYLRREVSPGVVLVSGVGGRGMTIAPAVAEATFA